MAVDTIFEVVEVVDAVETVKTALPHTYTMGEIIGKGSYGVVRAAVDDATGEKVGLQSYVSNNPHI